MVRGASVRFDLPWHRGALCALCVGLSLISMPDPSHRCQAAGFAGSLARPGGNMTGISLMSADLDGKRQEILIEAVSWCDG